MRIKIIINIHVVGLVIEELELRTAARWAAGHYSSSSWENELAVQSFDLLVFLNPECPATTGVASAVLQLSHHLWARQTDEAKESSGQTTERRGRLPRPVAMDADAVAGDGGVRAWRPQHRLESRRELSKHTWR